MVTVEIVYVPSDGNAIHKHLTLPDDSTVFHAILASGFNEEYPETCDLPVGIFARLVTLETTVKNGDRVELYRPLIVSPKDRRRQLARKSKVKR